MIIIFFYMYLKRMSRALEVTRFSLLPSLQLPLGWSPPTLGVVSAHPLIGPLWPQCVSKCHLHVLLPLRQWSARLPSHIQQLNRCASGGGMVLGTVLLPPNPYGREQDAAPCCLCSEASEAGLPGGAGMARRAQQFRGKG